MKQIILNSWHELPTAKGMQVHGFTDANKAFEYAVKEYLPYGYKTAIFCTDLNLLTILNW